jgi:hypothetical protein
MDMSGFNRGATESRNIFDRLVRDVESAGSRSSSAQAQAARRSEDAYQKMYRTIESGRQQFVNSQIRGSEEVASKIIGNAIKAGQERVKQEQQVAAEVLRIQKQTAQQAAQQEALRGRAARVIGDPTGITGVPFAQPGIVGMREGRAAAAELANTLGTTQQATEGLNASQIVLGVTIGNIVAAQAQKLFTVLKSGIIDTALYASRTEEMGFALESVAKANGIASSEILGQENAIKRLNITTQDTRQILSKMVIAQLDYTKATQLATAAQDLGVIAGQNTAEELQDLVQGITTLQPRVLRNAAIFTTAEEATRKYAKEVGKTVNEVSTQEKQTALMNEVLLQGARAVGTYDAAMNSASKQIRSMERLQAEASNAVGAFFQGPLKFVVSGLSELLKITEKYPGTMIALGASIAAVTVAFLALNATTSAFFAQAISGAATAIRNYFLQWQRSPPAPRPQPQLWLLARRVGRH